MKKLDFYFQDCIKNGYVLGAYNFVNLEMLKGICAGCKKTNSPALVCVSESALNYMGGNFVKNMFETAKKEYKLPIFLHLDHGKSFEVCKKAVDLGFDSVMIDASSLSFEENIKLTKKVTTYAHKKGVFVEAELGVLSGIEDSVKSDKTLYTDPKTVKEFVEKTGCDSLAVAIGTSHGAYKFSGKAKIRFDILKEIESEIPKVPLVLHGASSVPQKLVKNINKFGGKLSGARGIDEKILEKLAQSSHIYKINTDTDLRLCMTAAIRKNLVENPENIDIRKIDLIGEISKIVEQKNLEIFHNENRI